MLNHSHILMLCTLASAGLLHTPCLAQGPLPALPPVTRLPLWPAGSVPAGNESESDPAVPTVDIHLPDPGNATGSGVVVLPGGGYGGVSMDYEGRTSAQFLTANGIAAFVVRYRHAPRFHHPVPLQDACRAVRLVRSRASEFHISPDRIGLMGFSAGGHLASSVITHLDHGDPSASDPVAKISARPDFAILYYPVITFAEEAFVHKGSRTNLTADNKELWAELSNERHVTRDTPPVFLIHGGQDTVVPPENSMMFADACRKAGVSVELHVLSHGEHGFSPEAIRQESYTYLRHWLDRNGWLKMSGH